MIDWPLRRVVLGATPPPEAKLPLHAFAAPFAQGLQIRRNRRSGAEIWGGLAAAASPTYSIQSNPFLPSVWRMLPICISVWVPF